MSMTSTALRIARDTTSVYVQERETRTKYLLTLVKGEVRAARWKRPCLWILERLGLPVTPEYEVMGIYTSEGAARTWAEYCRKSSASHPADRWQIIPIVEDDGVPYKRIWQPDAEVFTDAEYEVVLKSDFEKLIHALS